MLDQTSAKAKTAPRRRMNHNFHREPSDTLQRMLNAVEPLSYIRPHRHLHTGKDEIFFVLRGRLAVVEFDDEGRVADHTVLDPDLGSWGVEIPPERFHTIISLKPATVAYEVKLGPYEPLTDKDFAPWAPVEGDPEAESFLTKILESLDIELL